MKVKDLKKIINNFDDNYDIGLRENGEIYDCYIDDDTDCRDQGRPCLVISREEY